jgi:hypothetical protein
MIRRGSAFTAVSATRTIGRLQAGAVALDGEVGAVGELG